jgi:hypothetical protein
VEHLECPLVNAAPKRGGEVHVDAEAVTRWLLPGRGSLYRIVGKHAPSVVGRQ